MLIYQRLSSHDEPRGTEAALLSVMIDECLLYGMQVAAVRQAFHGFDLVPLCVDGEHRARVHRLAVHQHGASAILRAIAYFLRTGQVEMIS